MRVLPVARRARRAGLAAALAAAPVALAYRFALVYRVRAGYPQRHPPIYDPGDVGLPFEHVRVPAPGEVELPGWFIPAGPDPAPGVALVHGWESARDRMLPYAQILHAAGFHVLAVDVRGHGANPPERLPISGGEFGSDAGAALDALLARPEVTRGALMGHSMGGIGVLLAAAADPRAAAVVAVSAPADPYRLTRQTFRLARLPLPGPIAWPLAWLTARVYVRPRRHTIGGISASRALARYGGPVLLVHGDEDRVVPADHLHRLAAAARSGRSDDPTSAPVETLVVAGGQHSWLYEWPDVRRTVARFLATALGGPYEPDEAAQRAGAVPAVRLPDPERFSAVDREPGGLRSIAGLVRSRGLGPAGPADTTTLAAPADEPLAAEA